MPKKTTLDGPMTMTWACWMTTRLPKTSSSEWRPVACNIPGCRTSATSRIRCTRTKRRDTRRRMTLQRSRSCNSRCSSTLSSALSETGRRRRTKVTWRTPLKSIWTPCAWFGKPPWCAVLPVKIHLPWRFCKQVYTNPSQSFTILHNGPPWTSGAGPIFQYRVFLHWTAWN